MFTLFLLVLALVVSSGLTSMTEAAIFSAPLSRVYLACDNESLGARRLLAIKRSMQRPVSALVILNNCLNIFGSIFVGRVAEEEFGSTWVGVFSAVLTFLEIIFREIIPKTLGERFSLGVALAAAPPLVAITRLLLPVIWVVERITRPFSSKAPPFVTSEEEIRMLARVGGDAGLITGDEKELISSAFQLNDVPAREMMTHRLELSTLDGTTRLSDIRPSEIDPTHSRILVTDDDDLDRITGVVHQRDVLRALAEGRLDLTIHDLENPVPFVHEGTHAQQLLRRFQQTRQHLFVVLDEYGGTRGVVTLEDVLEQLVGDILDETDPETETKSPAGDPAEA